MAVKKSNPVGTIFTIIIVLAIVGILYYGLIMATQAGPAADEAAERAEMRITEETIWNISNIPYDMLSEPFKAAITKEEYEEVMNQTEPTEKTVALFEKLDKVYNEPEFLQNAAIYYCGHPENPIKGVMKIKGIEYEVTQSISFAPNVKTFDPEVILWSVSVERITFAN